MRNSIFNRDGYSEIILTNGGRAAQVDNSNLAKLTAHTWSYSKLGYATTTINGQHYFMHRFIMGLSKGDGKYIDHINGDGLDNRLSNLRICTKSENQQNQRPRHVGRSKYKGIGYYVRDRKWRARIKYEGRDIELGKFYCEMCAAVAYDEAAKKYHSEFAWLNRDHFPEINDCLHPLREVNFRHGS